ncbi:triphosphoribosyl-dephospho-CoA synthase MdcB [Actimicrobium sp. CCI2.3]|uniref:triphosphoribosyl-dephospho-CoA synthase MdcB n=1 Tax=Actimicrobium sp. CCI2.3 TaxID=3048616 RepID=UPI002AB386BD|nr:triphosphoribosyl-dephospho-CoA synthase MdcB [Actimicrobium sp. CCI2.3]MDY7574865.1 triphosphoribosyl-dephospho-CoA synthase MdcB [Actimicrobium sp. CCI2.3]MEB0020174.1 triphosphoribosyl-dephospho-CoA synthase MdcB [Actimicrobium sp. CCI2.3]
MHELIFVASKRTTVNPACTPSQSSFSAQIGRHAVRSLHAELALYPKPGLVSLVDNGSHDDMTATTFLRSLFALRHYFIRITAAGAAEASFSTLQQLGIAAEARMVMATGGINTHRGAIFCVGMVCAAIGACRARQVMLTAESISATLRAQWGEALVAHTHVVAAPPGSAPSHGMQAAARHAASGAREEAALGLPSVFEVALPALQRTLAAGRSLHCAQVDAFFSLMAHISDTNVYHRGGAAGAALVKQLAQDFLARGGSAHPHWKDQALAMHQTLVRQRLSPGGAADLLAATCLVQTVTSSWTLSGHHYSERKQ